MAARAAQERPLDRVVAVRAGQLVELDQPGLGRRHLELALAGVVEELRRPQDEVHERPEEREEGRHRGAGDQHRVGHTPPRIRVHPDDQRQVDDDQAEDEQVDDEVERAVVDAEDHEGGSVFRKSEN